MPIKCSVEKCKMNSNNGMLTLHNGAFLCDQHLEEFEATQNRIKILIDEITKNYAELQALGVEVKKEQG